VAALRIEIDGKAIYEGEPITVPRVGDWINHDGQLVHVEGVEWDLSGDTIQVTLIVGEQPYTF
jgi:hypothetical protein